MNFVHIPKTGGTSIERVLGLSPCHERAAYYAAPRFTVVRHPLDRLVSGWAFVSKRREIDPRINVPQLELLMKQGHLVFQPQHLWFDAPIDLVLRFERLAEDFAQVSDVPLPHENASERKPGWDHLPADVRELAVRYYAQDFKQFGYEP